MKQFLKNGFEKMRLPVTDAQLSQFMRYYALLMDYNGRMNLTAITEPTDVCVKHFFDSASVLNAVCPPEGANMIDVGTGAGFPGLPVKILRPDLHVTLLDSLNKRVAFLKICVSELGLADAQCIHARAEDAAADVKYREQYSFAVSRAVARLSVLCEYCLPFVKTGGVFAALKGPAAQQELSAAKNACAVMGGADARLVSAEIAESDLAHSIVLIKKVRQTPLKYPRKGGKAAKIPI